MAGNKGRERGQNAEVLCSAMPRVSALSGLGGGSNDVLYSRLSIHARKQSTRGSRVEEIDKNKVIIRFLIRTNIKLLKEFLATTPSFSWN